MVSEEIITGLKNALDRGQPMEKAVQSLITAGYNPLEVKQAIQEVNTSILHHIPDYNEQPKLETKQPQQKSISTLPETQVQNQNKNTPIIQQQTQQPAAPKKKISGVLITLIIILIIILLATASFIFFGKEILDMLFPKV